MPLNFSFCEARKLSNSASNFSPINAVNLIRQLVTVKLEAHCCEFAPDEWSFCCEIYFSFGAFHDKLENLSLPPTRKFQSYFIGMNEAKIDPEGIALCFVSVATLRRFGKLTFFISSSSGKEPRQPRKERKFNQRSFFSSQNVDKAQ